MASSLNIVIYIDMTYNYLGGKRVNICMSHSFLSVSCTAAVSSHTCFPVTIGFMAPWTCFFFASLESSADVLGNS